jgi:hypothetical protein
MGGVFNYVNLHTYHYAGNNPVKLVDPTGEMDVFSNQLYSGTNSYNSWFAGAVKGTLQGIASTVGDFLGRKRNFIANVLSGKARASMATGVTFNIPGGFLSGSVKYSTENNGSLLFETPVDSGDALIESVQKLSGSPVIIKSNGVEVSAKIATVSYTEKSDNGTLKVELTSENILKNIDLNLSLSITASTQDGPFGTIKNGGGVTGELARSAAYYHSLGFVEDVFSGDL